MRMIAWLHNVIPAQHVRSGIIDGFVAMVAQITGTLAVIALMNVSAPAYTHYSPDYIGTFALAAVTLVVVAGLSAWITHEVSQRPYVVRSTARTVLWTAALALVPGPVIMLPVGGDALGGIVVFGPVLAFAGYRWLGFHDPQEIRKVLRTRTANDAAVIIAAEMAAHGLDFVSEYDSK